MVLTPRQWGAAILLAGLAAWALPRWGDRMERFNPKPEDRVPYEASKDYRLYKRLLNHWRGRDAVYFVGDSVVWGEYVDAGGTWTSFLNQRSDGRPVFVNAALNGLANQFE